MTLRELIEALPLTVMSASTKLDQEVTGGYVSDLLSNVMGQTSSGNLWVTMQAHQNVVAVASLAGLAGVIVAGGVEIDKEVLVKAEGAEVTLLSTALPAFEVVGLLYQAGIKSV